MKTTITVVIKGCEFNHYACPTAESTPAGFVEINSAGTCVALMIHSVQDVDRLVDTLAAVRVSMTAGDERN